MRISYGQMAKYGQALFNKVRILCCVLIFSASLLLPAVSYSDDIRSRAAAAIDASTGRVLFAKNSELKLPPASTTKLMTALVTLDRSDLNETVTISKRAAATAPTTSGLRAGDKVTIEALLYASLMKSANDAAVALAEAVAGSEKEFVRLMNLKALAIGARNTRFINSHGLPGQNQYTTAYDLALIMRQAIRHPVLKDILGTRITEVSTETGKTLFLKNTNKLLWSDDDLLGGKTGFTRKARHCFVCAGERDNETIIVALLGAPSRGVLWRETENLIAFGAKVIQMEEEPVVYLTSVSRTTAKATRTSYTQKSGYPGKKASLNRERVKSSTSRKEKQAVSASAKMRHGKSKTAFSVDRDERVRQKKVLKPVAKHKSEDRNVVDQGDDGSEG